MSIAEAVIPTPYIHSSQKRRKNIWFSQKDGNWSDPNTWISNALSYCQFNFNYPGQSIPIPTFPQVGDDVYINHSVTFDFQAPQVIYINNLYVSGTLKKAITWNYTLVVNGDCQATGTIDLSGATGTFVLKLMGVNNYINTFTSGTASTVYYARLGDQSIMNLSYRNLQIGGINTKTFTSDLTITGNFTIDVSTVLNTLTCDISSYNLTVNGTTTVGSLLKKSGSGSLTFVGQLLLSNTGNKVIDFSSGNPSVECRGGISSTNNGGVDLAFNSGTGTWTFSTNNQTIDCRGITALNFNGQFVISGAITITIDSTAYSGLNASYVMFSNSCTGTDANSKLLVKRNLYLTYTTSMPMASLGIFDFLTNSTSVLGFTSSSAFTIPYTTMNNLYIGIGTGTKTLSGNTVLNGSSYIDFGANLELSTYNFTNTGTINFFGLLSKSGAGNVIFIGQLIGPNNTNNKIDFSGGNPTVECRGGIAVTNMVTPYYKFGTGTWTFSTNNQTLNINGTITPTCPFLVSGAITVTLITTNNSGIGSVFTNTIDGNNASSVFDSRSAGGSTLGLEYQNSQRPMLTAGTLQANGASNMWRYDAAGAQDVTGATYFILIFGGSGVKTLQGNVVVNTTGGGSWSIIGTATINYNGFTITTI